EIRGGPGGNTFDIKNNNHFTLPTTILTGIGNDKVFVRRNGSQLKIVGQDGDDVVIVGDNNSVQGITGPLDIGDAFGFTTLTLNDQADAGQRFVRVGKIDKPGVVGGLAPADITFVAADVSVLTVNGPSGAATTFSVEATAPNRAVIVNGGNA